MPQTKRTTACSFKRQFDIVVYRQDKGFGFMASLEMDL
jgi:hypothetical protein